MLPPVAGPLLIWLGRPCYMRDFGVGSIAIDGSLGQPLASEATSFNSLLSLYDETHACTMKFFAAVVAAMLSVAVAFTPAAVRPATRGVVSSRAVETASA